jgi:hypothetical protein
MKRIRTGVTLIEMMIAISLSSFVFIIVSSLMMTLINNNTKSKRNEGFEQVKNDLQGEFTNRIRWGEVVEAGTDILTTDGINYTLGDGKILKDGVAITPENIKITSFEIKNLSTTPEFVSIDIKVALQSHDSAIVNDNLHLVVSQRKTTINQ